MLTKNQTNYEGYLTVQDLELEVNDSANVVDTFPLQQMNSTTKAYKYSKMDDVASASNIREPKKLDIEKLLALHENLPTDALEFIMETKLENLDSIPHAQWKHDMIDKRELPALDDVICDCHTDWNERFQQLCDTHILDLEKFSQLRDLGM